MKKLILLLSLVSFGSQAYSEKVCEMILKQKTRENAVTFIKEQVVSDIKSAKNHRDDKTITVIKKFDDDQVLATGYILYCEKEQ